MKKKNIIALLLFAPFFATAQMPETDIYVSNISVKDSKLVFSRPVNITRKAGYDNQPFFTADDKLLYYVSQTDTTQTDIYAFAFKDSSVSQVTSTPESEYSPVLSDDAKSMTVVRVDEDKAQRLYRFTVSAPDDADVILQNNDSVAYYAFMNRNSVGVCTLNRMTELHVYDLRNQQFIQLDYNIGRCMQRYPGSEDLCYLKKTSDSTGTILRFNEETTLSSPVCEALTGSQDFVITADGKIWMGKAGLLYEFNVKGNTWDVIADFSEYIGNFYRIALSPSGKRLALVSYSGKKP